MSGRHEGEVAVQQRVGVHERMADVTGRAIREHMPDQHREFFPQLPFIVVGSVDAEGQPWASVLANPPGFMQSPDATHLVVRARPFPGDPLALSMGQPLGLLGIQPHTRRRNRMNGVIDALDASGFTVRVQQSFGNCPKHIVPRTAHFVARHDRASPVRSATLDDHACGMIARADTLFIASAHPAAGAGPAHQGVDVSHRGGPAGFVVRDGNATLWLPDYAGNFFFNTLGNITVNPHAGLLFIDFERGGTLQLAVHAEVVWDAKRAEAFPGAQRLLRFDVTAMVHTERALPLRFDPPPQ